MYKQQGRPEAAKNLLRPVYERYDKDLETTDLLEARALLTSLE